MRIAWVIVGIAACATQAPLRDEDLSSKWPIVRAAGERTCAENVGPLVGSFQVGGGAWGEELGDLLRDRCLSDGWSAEARACAGDARYVRCLRERLAGWQRERLLGVVASDQKFELVKTPHYRDLACAAKCAPPEEATPCDRAARRMVSELEARHGRPAVPPLVWAGLTGVLMDQCRILEWPESAATCVGEQGITRACMSFLTPAQKHDPEVLIAMWLQQIERTFPPGG